MAEGGSLEYRVSDLERRIARLIQVGTVAPAEDGDPANAVRVRIGDRVSGPLRWTEARAGEDRTWWRPSEGEQVVVFAPNGDVVAAIVGDSLYQQDHPAPADSGQVRHTVYANGTEVVLDQESGVLKVAHPGDIEVSADGAASVEAGGDVSVNAGGDLTLEAAGNVTIKGSRVDLNP
ncbi:phage baseplate assembly protein V [Arhodomonas aquaeolei]|uniref:phage baseplate assembly protein V n=1 Tax=Arhodomonas aquaeolei TaxID=2369 RepID=UPI0021698535|nr:phage baseplate assembly protein V [Arhodomonas aquaeolei]MCS4503893.1 phage baseplate assembly protein V [Arhodomonas aquaeolei]